MTLKITITASGLAAVQQIARAVRRSAITSVGAFAIAMCANSSATLPPSLIKPVDFREGRLEKFFERYRCPEPRHVGTYLRVADLYGLDYRLLPALSIRETGCGAGQIRNNRWGYHPGRVGFATIEAGIDYVAKQLAQGAAYRGKTLRQKLFTYNPRPAYPGEVQRIMSEIQ